MFSQIPIKVIGGFARIAVTNGEPSAQIEISASVVVHIVQTAEVHPFQNN
jgi:hypothetical protein